MTRAMPDDFDVFLSHSSRDKPLTRPDAAASRLAMALDSGGWFATELHRELSIAET
jgi:hypothetical protein